MNFLTSSYVHSDLREIVRADSVVGGFWPEHGGDVVLPWPSAEFDRLHQVILKCDTGVRVSCRINLTPAEERAVEYWQLHLDSFCALTEKDNRWRKREWDGLSFVPGTSCVKRFEKFRISKLRPIRKVTGHAQAVCFPEELILLLQQRDLVEGAHWTPISDLRGEFDWPGMRLLVVDSLIGPIERNPSVDEEVGEADCEFLVPRAWSVAMGDLQLDSAVSFNLTTEPVEGDYLGSTIVSDSVRDAVLSAGFKGAFFTPVMRASTGMYSDFLSEWERLRHQVMSNPKNRLR